MPKETRSGLEDPDGYTHMPSANPNQIQVHPFYHDLRNQLVCPTDVLVSSHYFFRTWKPRLGPVLTLLILELRDKCYRNRQTGETRDYCWPSQSELARAMGVSVDTIARALMGEFSKLFIKVEPRYRYDPIRRKKVRTSSIYHIAMDDPLVPEDEEALRELLDKEKVDNMGITAPNPQNADQDSSRKMREEEGYEDLENNVNDKKSLSEDEKDKREYVAGELARQLDDQKNINYYRSIAGKYPDAVLFEAASIVKDVYRQGKVRKSRGALFVELLKRRTKTSSDDSL